MLINEIQENLRAEHNFYQQLKELKFKQYDNNIPYLASLNKFGKPFYGIETYANIDFSDLKLCFVMYNHTHVSEVSVIYTVVVGQSELLIFDDYINSVKKSLKNKLDYYKKLIDGYKDKLHGC